MRPTGSGGLGEEVLFVIYTVMDFVRNQLK